MTQRGDRGNNRGGGGGRGGGRGGRGNGRNPVRQGINAENRAEITARRNVSIQIGSEATDDILVAPPLEESQQDLARLILNKQDFDGFRGQRQIRKFVHSLLVNLSNHHSVDTSGLLPLMASSQGLARLREILQRPMSINAGNFIDRTSFQYVILPLIGVLTRENFCQSTMVQLSETIYAEVYRHKEMFLDRGVLACMRELINRRSMDDISPDRDELRRDNSLVQVASLQHAMLAVVRLVYQLLKRVTGAKSTMGETVSDIQTLVAACIRSSDNSEMSCFISHYLERECQRLIDMVSNTTHSVIEQAVTPTANLVHLKLSFDPPGHLSADGPRHNNDHALIKDIQIVPTQDELICTRPPFLPSNDVAGAPHHLQPGWARLLDTHFRLNREDMIDQLRQGILAFTDAMSKTSPDEYSKLLNRKELREILGFDVNLYVYGNVEFLGTDTSRSRQGMIRVSFDQPASINGEPEKKQAIFWERSKRRLMQGSLVCFIYPTRGPDANAWAPLGKEDFHLFLGVVAVRDIGQMTKDRKKATIHISLTHPEEYLRFIKACQSNKDLSQKCFMVESTGGFFEAYRPILRTLQTCEPAEMPFGKYLAPNDEHSTNLSIKSVDPPLYSRAPGFKFDLSSILRAPATYQLDTQDLESQRRAVSILRTHSTLDDTQAEALVNSLCREVALISGPPGTGKTKIGVDLMRVLVENAKQVNSGPILCICYTNHALDQFLDHLLDQGITNLVRIGARSQSDRLRQYALHALERAHAKGYAVRSAIAKNFEALEEATSKLEKLDKIIRHPEMQVSHILTHIEADDDYHYEDFLRGNPKDAQSKGIRSAEDNYRRWLACADLEHMMKQNKRLEKKLRKMQKKTMERYGLSDDESPSESQSESSLADIDAEPVPKRLFVIPNTNRPIHVLLNSHVWSMSKRERQRIHDFWSGQVQADLERKYTELQKQIQLLSDMNTAAYDEVRRRILCKAHVVGMTTNGAAKNQSMIAALSSRIIMCEEAGEVLESHILAALSGSTQHIILIGDHLQLRPQVATYELSSDSRLGCQYNLDRSLFERLVTTGKIPSSPLATQRRMRPEICNLVRKSLYEYLEDGEMVLAYPHVSGMAKDLFFMNHRHPEDNRDQYGIQSYANTFEAEMIRSLVIHLMKNGYQRSSIAVLTPYLGQLTRLRDKLRDIVRLQIDERDQYQLDAHEEETSTTNDSPKLVSTPQTLTLRTIDNFQGEEADIIIVSLVRSDTREDHGGISQTIGFLKSSNRTNVLLSRARHGMYLIGNARLMDQPKNGIWPKVMAELSRNQSIGDGFPLRCSNHPDAELLVSSPKDFAKYAPNGGCTKDCDQPLSCGHICRRVCHADDRRHEKNVCTQPCTRLLPQCNHVCLRKCNQPCGDCLHPVGELLLQCGHVFSNARCYQKKDPSKARCKTIIERQLRHCEHAVAVECHKDPETIKCQKECGVILKCGHPCTKKCSECQDTSSKDKLPSGKIQRTVHSNCQQKCGRLMHCGHSCDAFCHVGNECPPCNQKCILKCTHSKGSHPCNSPCPACCEPCPWTCSHHGKCQLPCGAPCSRLPCNRRCEKKLKCGHQCPSVCGEKCPPVKFCVECKGDSSAMEMVVDVIMQTPLSEVDLNDDPLLVFSCGHALVMSSLDGLMGLSDYYESNTNPYTGITSFVKVKPLPHDEVSMVTCPSCRTPIVDLFRYGRRIKYSQLVKRLKHFEISQSQAIIDAEKSLASAQAAIGESLPAFLKKISESKAPAMKDPSGMTNRRLLGKFEQEGALFPNTDVESLLRSYDIPYKQESAWRGLIRPVLEVLKAFNMIQEQAINSPPRRLFEASVSHLYRFKSQVFYVGMAETGYETIQWSPEESERAIAESARECGLSPDHQAGSSFIRAIQGRTNALLLIMQAAVEAMEKGGEINSGWHWFVDDLLQCCLIHAVIQRDAAIKGCYHRIEMCACMTILNVLYRRMKWIGRWPFDKSDPKQLQTRQMAIDQVLEPFMAALRAIENSDRLRAEYLPKARQIESEIVTATKVALHQLHQPLTESEKFEIFLALQVQLSGTGHFYRCPNGHTYTIDRCGRAMQESTCPECGARVGGSHHQLTEGNQVDTEYESFYRRL